MLKNIETMIVGKKSFLPLVRVGSIRRTCRHSGLEQKESVQRNRPTVNREIFRFMNCKNIEEVRDCLIALRAELDVKETVLETYKKNAVRRPSVARRQLKGRQRSSEMKVRALKMASTSRPHGLVRRQGEV